LALAGCDRDGGARERRPPPPEGAAARRAVPDQISGTLTFDGRPLAIKSCRPGQAGGLVHVDLVTASGALRFVAYDASQMFWNSQPESTERGAPLPCTELRRSWGGGPRPDGTAYFRGRLVFSCRGAAGAVAGDVTVDCGNISPLERQLLDQNRQQKLDELERPGTP
jgi:hypothetical protein